MIFTCREFLLILNAGGDIIFVVLCICNESPLFYF